MTYDFDYGVYIGKLMPHNGHLHTMMEALKRVRHLIVVIGSADKAPEPELPFSYMQRREMVELMLIEAGLIDRVIIVSMRDYPHSNEAWLAAMHTLVNQTILSHGNSGFTANGTSDFKIALAGFEKDHTSFYLNMFPEWGEVKITNPRMAFSQVMSSTQVREWYFDRVGGPDMEVVARLVPPSVAAWLADYAETDEYYQMQLDRQAVVKYREEYGEGPFLTVDALCTQSGAVLCGRRTQRPGIGQLCILGGFVGERKQGKLIRETLRQATVRELMEEGVISDGRGPMPPAVVASYIDESETTIVDLPHRDPRANIVTVVRRFKFPDRRERFIVSDGDDAADVAWRDPSTTSSNEWYGGHNHILEMMLGIELPLNL